MDCNDIELTALRKAVTTLTERCDTLTKDMELLSEKFKALLEFVSRQNKKG